MKNILFLSSWYPSKVHKTLGNFVQYHANAISLKNKVYVLYVTPHSSNSFEISNSIDNNVDTTIVYFNKGKFKYLNYFIAFRKGLSLLMKKRKISFDLAQMNILHPACWQALYIKWIYKLPFIVSENWHGFQDLNRYNIKGIRKYLIKLTIKNASFVCPVSKQLQNSIEKAGFDGSFKVVPNVVNTNIFSLSPSNNSSTFTFLHVSTLTDSIKNISGILNSFSRLNQDDLRLRIIGDGDTSWIREKSKELKIDNQIIIDGEMTYTEISQAMKDADAFVLFSNIENLPLVLIESLSTGTPIITTNVGGISEIFNDSLGIMIDSGNEEQLVDAMHNMVDNISTYKPQEIRNYAVNNFSQEIISDRFDDLYQKTIKNNNII